MAQNKATGRWFPVQNPVLRKWEKKAVEQLRIQYGAPHRPPITGPVHINAFIFRERATGDLINYMAALSDALERSGVLANDRQIVNWDGTRMGKDADRPRIEVTISWGGDV